MNAEETACCLKGIPPTLVSGHTTTTWSGIRVEAIKMWYRVWLIGNQLIRRPSLPSSSRKERTRHYHYIATIIIIHSPRQRPCDWCCDFASPLITIHTSSDHQEEEEAEKSWPFEVFRVISSAYLWFQLVTHSQTQSIQRLLYPPVVLISIKLNWPASRVQPGWDGGKV